MPALDLNVYTPLTHPGEHMQFVCVYLHKHGFLVFIMYKHGLLAHAFVLGQQGPCVESYPSLAYQPVKLITLFGGSFLVSSHVLGPLTC